MTVVEAVAPVPSCERDNGGCSELCSTLDSGVTCSCQRAGYKLSNDNKSCMDIDECEEGTSTCNTTSQMCVNSLGSFYCLEKNLAGSG